MAQPQCDEVTETLNEVLARLSYEWGIRIEGRDIHLLIQTLLNEKRLSNHVQDKLKEVESLL